MPIPMRNTIIGVMEGIRRPMTLVAPLPAGNHHQGKCNGQERAENIEVGHEGKVKIHRSTLAKKMLRYQKMRDSSKPAYTRNRCRLSPEWH